MWRWAEVKSSPYPLEWIIQPMPIRGGATSARTLNVALLFLGTVLCGCTTHYRNFSHPGYGQAEFDQDKYQCQRENSHQAVYINDYGASAGTEVDQSMVQSCLAAQGWRPAEK
jgi:hypothetical protein